MAYETNAELEKEVAKANREILAYKTNRVWAIAMCICLALSFTAVAVVWHLNTASNNGRIVEVTKIQTGK